MSNSAAPARLAASEQRSVRFYVSAWLPVVLMIGCIAVETQAFLGSDHTDSFLRPIVEWLTGPLADPRWESLHHIIRKCGHFTGYGLLSFTWFRTFWKTYRTERSRSPRKLTAHLLAMAGTLLVASADEFHQSFLPNRTGTPVDVMIDCSGALAVQLVIFLVMLRFFRDDRRPSH